MRCKGVRPALTERWNFSSRMGKYHWDGHQACGLCLSRVKTEACGGRCPSAAKITIGVQHRVEQLADRPEGFSPARRVRLKACAAAGCDCCVHWTLPPRPQGRRAVLSASGGAWAGVLYSAPSAAGGHPGSCGWPLCGRRHPPPAVRAGVRTPGFSDGQYGTVQLLSPDEIES